MKIIAKYPTRKSDTPDARTDDLIDLANTYKPFVSEERFDALRDYIISKGYCDYAFFSGDELFKMHVIGDANVAFEVMRRFEKKHTV